MIELSSPLIELSDQIRSLVKIGGPRDFAFCTRIAKRLERFLNNTDWIPQELTLPTPANYRRETLFDDPDGLFTIGCLTWAPGQMTPIHDHRSWGVIGIAAGLLRSETFDRKPDGSLQKRAADDIIGLHAITMVDPFDNAVPDIHRLGSATDDISVSIHIYGCPLSRINLHRYDVTGRKLA